MLPRLPFSAGGRCVELCPFSLKAQYCLQWLFPQEGGEWVTRVTREVGDLHHWGFLGKGCRNCNKTTAMVRNLTLNEQLL